MIVLSYTEQYVSLSTKKYHIPNKAKSQFLSKINKIIFIEYIIQAIPLYIMSTVNLSMSICKYMDTLVSKFWRGVKSKRFMALKFWNSIYNPKCAGGLIRKFEYINAALLAKMGWLLAKGDWSLWTS